MDIMITDDLCLSVMTSYRALASVKPPMYKRAIYCALADEYRIPITTARSIVQGGLRAVRMDFSALEQRLFERVARELHEEQSYG